MSEELKTRLTDEQITDLEANLPLADIIGAHSDHRLKELLNEIQLVYNLSPSFLKYYTHNIAALAAAATFVPPKNTIVMLARGYPADAINLVHQSTQIQAIPQTGLCGIVGATMCDGTLVGYKNSDVGSAAVDLYGVTLA